jgi:subtilisin family serine protease
VKRRKGWSRIVVALLVVFALVMSAIPAAADDVDNRQERGFLKAEHQRLVEAIARGDTEITIIVASKAGENNEVASDITHLSGTVEHQDNAVSYLRATVPVDRAVEISTLDGIQGIDLDEVIDLGDPRPEGASNPTPQTPPGASTPRNNPYMPIGDTGAAQFVTTNPTWDGRGITVAIVDSGVDLSHPSLNTTSTGERKIVDWVTYTDGSFTGTHNNDDDPTWVLMSATNSGGYSTPPGVGTVRYGVFNERDPRLAGELGNDVNRDGNPAGSDGTFGVLWEPATNQVWVDTNQNKTFADDAPMTDYKVNHNIGTFGTDNLATAINESMPFVVQVDSADNSVNIGIVSGEHGSHVAGIVAGNQMFGGQMGGAAPGAKLVSVRVCLFITGCTNHALLEGMIYAVTVAHVDVINMSIGGLPALNDGNKARAILYNNLIDQGVQMFISAGNDGPGINSIGDPSVATKVVSVGSYINKATWQKNYGSDSAYVDNMHPFSSRGPREDGGFKPNIIAPGAAISTIPTFFEGGPVGGTYPLPPGYAMLQGTSMASPQAAGAAAVLLSAAKATSLTVTPSQLRQALYSTARLLDTNRIQVVDQGNGLISVSGAWAMLKQNIQTVTFTSSVEVNTPIEQFLATPGVGVGIYDRPVEPGGAYTRQYTLTRTSGASGLKTYKVSWVGNDGTFSSPNTVQLAPNTPVTFNVRINPVTRGVHSAILDLDDPATIGIDYQTMNVVIAPETFAGPTFSVTKSGTVGRNQFVRYFYDVPAGVPAFKVDLTGGGNTPGAGQIRFLRYHPYGLHLEGNASTNCYTPDSGAGCDSGDPNSRTVANPLPGVWEVTVEARRTSDTVNAPYTLTASILGATVSPNPDNIPSATIGVPITHNYTFTNQFGAFTGRAIGSTLGSARILTPTIADLGQTQRQIAVTPGSTSLTVTIGSPSDPGADLDLYLFNCTSGSCVLAAQSADGDAEESVTVNNPAAGVWISLIDGFAVPAGTTTYHYSDVFVNPAFGSVVVTDANALHAAGSSWTRPGVLTVLAAPASGRVLLGNIQVVTSTNIVIGSGQVIVQAVTP